MDVRVFNPFAPSYRNTSLSQCYRKNELEKRRAYDERIREVEHGSFSPLVFSTAGGMGATANVVYKRIASLMTEKHGKPYSKTINWLRLASPKVSSNFSSNLTEEQKQAVLQPKNFLDNAMAEEIARKNPVGVDPDMMANWTEDQRRQFTEDWANDDGLCKFEQLVEVPLPEPSETQMGEGGNQKHDSDDVPSKCQRSEEYFRHY
ncbi:Hypothetical predicted protein [Paramuricea clavata]|uniref:Uncharacterized protein n=1 Tax=Paramuricea clavata TaxID=317549 RepID=A0A6S7IUD9_PARCT|nr:Hypothetical predicted protein [Paramuricea clavata]